jgi:methionyl-tRNA formyltransferase
MLELLEVQIEGKKRLPVADFLRGASPQAHERLGS